MSAAANDEAEGAWAALVAAEQEAARRRAAMNRSSERSDLLRGALASGSAWNRSTALTFLRLFPADVPELLEPLVDVALAGAWAQPVSEAIRAALPEIDMDVLADVVLRHADADDYAKLAQLLIRAEAWGALVALLTVARDRGDPAVRSLARELGDRYGSVLPGWLT